MRREKVEESKEKTKTGKNDESKKSGRRIGNLEWERRDKKVWRGGQEICTSKIPRVDLYLWEESEWEDTNKEDIELYNWVEGEFVPRKGKSTSFSEKKEKKYMSL